MQPVSVVVATVLEEAGALTVRLAHGVLLAKVSSTVNLGPGYLSQHVIAFDRKNVLGEVESFKKLCSKRCPLYLKVSRVKMELDLKVLRQKEKLLN